MSTVTPESLSAFRASVAAGLTRLTPGARADVEAILADPARLAELHRQRTAWAVPAPAAAPAARQASAPVAAQQPTAPQAPRPAPAGAPAMSVASRRGVGTVRHNYGTGQSYRSRVPGWVHA